MARTISYMSWFKKSHPETRPSYTPPARRYPALDTTGFHKLACDDHGHGPYEPQPEVDRVLVMDHPVMLHDDDFDLLFAFALRFPNATHFVWGGHTPDDRFPIREAQPNELHQHGDDRLEPDMICEQILVHRSNHGEVWNVCYRDQGTVSLVFQTTIAVPSDASHPDAVGYITVASSEQFWLAYPHTNSTAHNGTSQATRLRNTYLLRPNRDLDIDATIPVLLEEVVAHSSRSAGGNVERSTADVLSALRSASYSNLLPEFENVLNVPEHFLRPDMSDDVCDFATLLVNIKPLIENHGAENIKTILIGDPRTSDQIEIGVEPLFDYMEEPYGDGIREALSGAGLAELAAALPALRRIVAVAGMELDFIASRRIDSTTWMLN